MAWFCPFFRSPLFGWAGLGDDLLETCCFRDGFHGFLVGLGCLMAALLLKFVGFWPFCKQK
jgi:hypothetical protein